MSNTYDPNGNWAPEEEPGSILQPAIGAKAMPQLQEPTPAMDAMRQLAGAPPEPQQAPVMPEVQPQQMPTAPEPTLDQMAGVPSRIPSAMIGSEPVDFTHGTGLSGGVPSKEQIAEANNQVAAKPAKMIPIDNDPFDDNDPVTKTTRMPAPMQPDRVPGPDGKPASQEMSFNARRIRQIDANPRLARAIENAAARHGLPAEFAKVVASIESGGNPFAKTGSYEGVFQMSRKQMGGQSTFDLDANVDKGIASLKADAVAFKNAMGRDPTPNEIYMSHQQGRGGVLAHVRNPDQPAWKNMLSTGEGQQKGERWAKLAIWGNIPSDEKGRYGSVENVTSRDLMAIYERKIGGGGGSVNVGGFRDTGGGRARVASPGAPGEAPERMSDFDAFMSARDLFKNSLRVGSNAPPVQDIYSDIVGMKTPPKPANILQPQGWDGIGKTIVKGVEEVDKVVDTILKTSAEDFGNAAKVSLAEAMGGYYLPENAYKAVKTEERDDGTTVYRDKDNNVIFSVQRHYGNNLALKKKSDDAYAAYEDARTKFAGVDAATPGYQNMRTALARAKVEKDKAQDAYLKDETGTPTVYDKDGRVIKLTPKPFIVPLTVDPNTGKTEGAVPAIVDLFNPQTGVPAKATRAGLTSARIMDIAEEAAKTVKTVQLTPAQTIKMADTILKTAQIDGINGLAKFQMPEGSQYADAWKAMTKAVIQAAKTPGEVATEAAAAARTAAHEAVVATGARPIIANHLAKQVEKIVLKEGPAGLDRYTMWGPYKKAWEEAVDAAQPVLNQKQGAGGSAGAASKIVMREVGVEAASDAVAGLSRPGHLYRGMDAQEFNATLGAGGGVKSTRAHSVPSSEGTSFAGDAATAESYANFGRSDPRKTGKPTYLVEVEGEGGLKVKPDGYHHTFPLDGEVARDRVTRVWKMSADKDGAITAEDVTMSVRGKSAEKIGSFTATPEGKMIGYRVVNLDKDGRLVSQADSRTVTEASGDYGVPAYVSNDPKHVIDHYGHGVWGEPGEPRQALVKMEFDQKDILKGNPADTQPELSIRNGRILSTTEIKDEAHAAELSRDAALYAKQGAGGSAGGIAKIAEKLWPGFKEAGLPMDQASRMERAAAQGFNIDAVHGTRAAEDFTVFKRKQNDMGMHFGSKGQGNDRLAYTSRHSDPENVSGDRLIPVKLNINNPLRMDDAGAWDTNNVPFALERTGKFTKEEINAAMRGAGNESGKLVALRELIKRKGYDGIVYKNTGETSGATEMQKVADEAWGKYRDAKSWSNKPAGQPIDEAGVKKLYDEYKVLDDELRAFRETNAEDSYIAFHPQQIRSSLAAAFDPAARESGSMLAAKSGAGGGAGGLAKQLADKVKKLVDEVPGFKAVVRYMEPDEIERARKASAVKIIEMVRSVVPSSDEMASIAYAGRAKKGWLKNSGKAVIDVFGADDAPRFTALLSALSPQTGIEDNTINALNVWKNWIAAGRPTERNAIIEIMGRSVQGTGGNKSVLDAWINNSVRALTHESPNDLVLSGPKVNSFHRNLRGHVRELTLDAHIANYSNLPGEFFKGTGTDILGKGPRYVAFNVAMRKAAEILSKRTGQTWVPEEIQETIWSWAKALKEKADSIGTDGAAQKLLRAGGLTHDDIAGVPDFELLFIQGAYRRILEETGYGQQIEKLHRGVGERSGWGAASDAAGSDVRAAEGAGIARSAFEADLDRAAGRIDALRAEQRAAAGGGEAGGAPGASASASPRRVPPAERAVEERLRSLEENFEERAAILEDGGLPRATADGVAKAEIEALRGSGKYEPAQGLPMQPLALGDGRYVIPSPVARSIEAAESYAKRAGIDYQPPKVFTGINTDRAKRIAQAFDEMKHDPDNPVVKRAYDAMIRETVDQWNEIKKTGLKVEFIKPGMADPYDATPRLAQVDVRDNNHLWVFPTDGGFGSAVDGIDLVKHPLMQPTSIVINGRRLLANDLFRIVHDYFGHIKDGNGFRAAGEEHAWRSHSAMYSPEARMAMTAETRGQNSWLNYGPHGDKNRKAKTLDTVFAQQKVGVLPDWVINEGRLDPGAAPAARAADDGIAILSKQGAGGGAGAAAKLMENPAFVKWFGESKVVDDAGVPVTVYHGTNKKFSAFSKKATPGGVTWFSSDKDAIARGDAGAAGRDNIMELHASIKNPAGWPEYEKYGLGELRSRGYDGVILKDKDGSFDGFVFEPTQLKSVNNRGTYDPDKANIFHSKQGAGGGAGGVSKVASPFYSAVEHAVETLPLKTGTADQWLGTLKNAKGVKQEELDWIGVPDFLAEKKAAGKNVTREELAEFIAQNKVELKDVTKGEVKYTADHPAVKAKVDKYVEEWRDDYSFEEGRKPSRAEVDDVRESYIIRILEDPDSYFSKAPSTSRFGEWRAFEGGENYQEHLITLPQKPTDTTGWTAKAGAGDPASGPIWEVRDAKGKWVIGLPRENLATPEEAMQTAANRYRAEGYKHSHWPDDPNVIAHTRTDDRVIEAPGFAVKNTRSGNQSEVFPTRAAAEEYQSKLPASVKTEIVDAVAKKKTLLLHELQSDWMQTGRKQGFKQDINLQGLKEEQTAILAKMDDAERKMPREVFSAGGFSRMRWIDENMPELKSLEPRLREIQGQISANEHALPDAPFKKSWEALALKRMIRKAVEEGYDQIAWAPGEKVAEMFDLSKQVDNVIVMKTQDGNYDLIATVGGRRQEIKENAKADEIERHVGKSLAEKVLAQTERTATYEGVDLKIGAGPMRKFYDEKLVNIANQIAKPFGGKVTKGELRGAVKNTKDNRSERAEHLVLEHSDVMRPESEHTLTLKDTETGEVFFHGPNTDANYKKANEMWKELSVKPQAIHVLEITPEMRAAAMGTGFPMFARTGAGGAAGAVSKLMVPVEYDPFAADGSGSKSVGSTARTPMRPRFIAVDHNPFQPGMQ